MNGLLLVNQMRLFAKPVDGAINTYHSEKNMLDRPANAQQSSTSNPSSNIYSAVTVLAVLITIGITSRFWLSDIPNFKPIAAIALFAAFYFQRFWVSAIAVFLVMLVSNLGLADCPWQVTTGVIAGLLMASALGRKLQSIHPKTVTAKATKIAGASLVMSIAFFAISNAAVWMTGQWYPLTLEGLSSCFAAAVPFFRYTVCGDLIFSGAIFGAYFAVKFVLENKKSFNRQLGSSVA